MTDQAENPSYGTVTVAAGTRDAHELQVVDFVRAEYADHRLISAMTIEDGGIILSVENPKSTARNPDNTMWLSRQSAVGLLTTLHLYFSAKGSNLSDLMKEAAGEQVIYHKTPNLGEATLK